MTAPAHRSSTARIPLLASHGAPLADAEVVVEQRRHAFGFGNIGFDFIALANPERPEALPGIDAAYSHLQELAALWLDLFNSATLPFYWGAFECARGEPDTLRLQRTARWFKEQGVRVKGHPLVWHTVAPDWLMQLDEAEVESVLRARIRREVEQFHGLVDSWDAINESVIMPVFDNGANAITPLAARLGRLGMIRLAFEEARSADAGAELHINDFDLSADYEAVIEEALAAGIRIDGIGLQSHMHQGYRGEDHLLAAIERFSRFGLPIHLTETTLVSGELMPAHISDLNDYRPEHWPSTPEGEARQADELERHYRSLFGRPEVASITYWGIGDEGAWLGAPAGLVRRDGTAKPSYQRLHELIKGEWWLAPTTVRSDAHGVVEVSGAFGEYRLSAGGQHVDFVLDGDAVPGAPLQPLRLSAD